MKFLIPAKTFIIGEYSALVGGSVLAAATNPGFTVEYESQTDFQFPFAVESPAGKLWATSKSSAFQFRDQIQVGGFGKSTAEYLAVLLPDLKGSDDFQKLRNEYVKLSHRDTGARVSGIDLATQYFGRILHFDSNQEKFQSLDWQFPELDFILVSTGIKIKTHEHLEHINLKSIESFPSVSDALIQTYFDRDYLHFVRAVKEWSLFLQSNKLIDSGAGSIAETIAKLSDVLVAKPCGALGADVIFVLCDAEKSQVVQKQIVELGLSIKATAKDLAPGVCQQLTKVSERGLHVD